MPLFWDEPLEAIETTEVHWGMGTILAIFFAASLVSAVFFGLGYTFGRGGTSNSAVSAAFSGIGAPTDGSAAEQSPQHGNATAAIAAQSTTVPQRSIDGVKRVRPALTQTAAIHSAHAADIPARAAQVTPIDRHAKRAATGAGAAHYMVQVGAIGNREDARMLVSELRKSGFHAGIYPGKHDRFLHVQIGPFATAEQAQIMRHHAMASGFRAILKRAS